jgi:hypothetical protein
MAKVTVKAITPIDKYSAVIHLNASNPAFFVTLDVLPLLFVYSLVGL